MVRLRERKWVVAGGSLAGEMEVRTKTKVSCLDETVETEVVPVERAFDHLVEAADQNVGVFGN